MTTDNVHHGRTMCGIMLMLTAVFMFSAMDTLAKYLLKSNPMSALMWARYAVHMAVMLILLWPRMGLQLLRTSRPGLQVLRGLLLVASAAARGADARHGPARGELAAYATTERCQRPIRNPLKPENP